MRSRLALLAVGLVLIAARRTDAAHLVSFGVTSTPYRSQSGDWVVDASAGMAVECPQESLFFEGEPDLTSVNVQVTSPDSSAVFGSAYFPQGSFSVTFQIVVPTVTTTTTIQLSAKATNTNYRVGDSYPCGPSMPDDPGLTASLTLVPPPPPTYTLSVNPNRVDGHTSSVATLTRAPAPQTNTPYALQATDCSIGLASTMPAGSGTLNFDIAPSEVPQTMTEPVNAYDCSASPPALVAQATLTILGDTSQDDHGPCDECEGAAGQPINLGTGDVWITQQEYVVPGLGGGLTVTRTWNSLWATISPIFQAGMFGQGWISTYEERLQVQDASHIKYWRSDGSGWIFTAQADGTYTVSNPLNAHATLTTSQAGSTILFASGMQEAFDSNGLMLSTTDRNGNATLLSYDGASRLTSVTSAGGQTISFSYDDSSCSTCVTTIQDALGTVATYTYDSGALTLASYPDHSQLNYTYDASRNILSATDALGKIVESHTYDGQGRGLSSAKANGVEALAVQYMPDGSVTLADSLGNASTYYFDSIGGRSRIDSVFGTTCASCGVPQTAFFGYDDFGNKSVNVDANFNATAFEYDSVGNVTFVGRAGANSFYTYNSFGEVLTATDALGNVTTNVYDVHGNLTSTTAPSPDGVVNGPSTTFQYDGVGQLVEIDDPRGGRTTFSYTPQGLVSSLRDAVGAVTSYEYDARGRRTAVVDALGGRTMFTYDAMGRVTRATAPDASHTDTAYDYRGRRSSTTDATGHTTQYGYDDADRLTRVTDAANNTTVYSYDTENNLIGIQDASGHLTAFSYNADRQVVQTTFPSGLSETYSYDAVGNILTKTDRNGAQTTYAYDPFNRLTSKVYADGSEVDYTYDLLGRLTQASGTGANGTFGFTYDSLGRLVQTSTQYSFLAGQPLVNSYAYDAASNRISLTNPQGGVTAYTYDGDNRVAAITDFAGSTFGFGYDPLGRRTSLARPNGVNTSYAYDAASHLLSVLHQSATATLDGTVYTYDASGNRTSRTALPSALTSSFSYDPLYQLTQVTRSSDGQVTEKYTYDAVGNRLTSPGAPYTYDPSNELVSREGVPFTYNANGDRVTKGSGANQFVYGWDSENRLTSVNLPSGGALSFRYDPFGRRISKTNPSGTTIYVYDGENVIEELNASGGLGERYTYGPGIDEPLVGQRQPQIFYYEADGLGSITSLTGTDGTLAATYTYDSFGFLTNSTGSATNWRRYTAREFDSDTGLYYNRARYYDSQIGRFISEDPLRFFAGPNFFQYVRNNPTDFEDPSGLCADRPQPSQECLDALATAGADATALANAAANWDAIQTAATANGVDPALLAAIGVRESGFRNVPQNGAGQGLGVFQIDLGQNPSVTRAQASDLTFAANFAAQMLSRNMTTLTAAHPNLTPLQLQQATAASYNFGTGNISGNPSTIDVGTTRGNYGSNVLALMVCFR